MSWIEQTQAELIIRCGDGKEYRPLWLNAAKDVEYNVSEFNFPNLPGTLVARTQVRGSRYALEVYFQGEDHLSQALAFEVSARDARAWTVSHPFYGAITVQPISLNFDFTKYNVSRITGTIVETIDDGNPKATLVPVDKINDDKSIFDEVASISFDNNVQPDTADINTLTANALDLYTKGAVKAADTSEAESYLNLFNSANAAIIDATAEPLAAIQKTQALLSAPSQFKVSAQTRVNLFVDQFEGLNNSVSNIVTRSEKKIFENNAGTLLAAMAVSAATPLPGNYGSRGSVLSVIDLLLANYNLYLLSLDSLQSANGGNVDSYMADAETLTNLDGLIKYTISSLFAIALNAKQERSVYIEDDSNIILLAHRFYGLDESDNSINELIANNNIGLSEMLGLRKGRKIIYYV